MWECGLKPLTVGLAGEISRSLLMWECGLKLTVRDENVATDSHSLCGSVD